jgi:UV DNA damage repair endonuclease
MVIKKFVVLLKSRIGRSAGSDTEKTSSERQGVNWRWIINREKLGWMAMVIEATRKVKSKTCKMGRYERLGQGGRMRPQRLAAITRPRQG